MNDNQQEQIWDCIHIFAKTFDPYKTDERESFVCFFECLCDLLPSNELRSWFATFLTSNPPQNHTTSQNDAFAWSCKLHTYIILCERKQGKSTQIITLDKLSDKYKLITREDWSNAIWFVLHFFTSNLPQQITPQIFESVKAFCVCLMDLLPCPKCKAHMKTYLAQHPIDMCKSGSDLFRWTCEYHFEVNSFDQKNQPPMDLKKLYSFYHIFLKQQTSSSFEYIDE